MTHGRKLLAALALGLLLGIPFYAWAALNVTLSWTDQSNNETGFRIERNVNGGAYTVLTTTAANITSYNDTNTLSLGNTYCYKVIAFNAFGDATSPAPNVICTTPNIPVGAILISVIAQP